MSGRFVRASKYRHVYGQPSKKELCYENVRVSKNAWDASLLKVNPLYMSVNWDASGGGAFAVIPLSEKGKLPDQIPLFRGHKATVLDTDWNPFDDHMVASASEDGKVGIWKVPDDFTVHLESAADIKDIAPASFLSGHTRKVGHVLFHPVANNVLASSSGDYTVKLWDIEAGKPKSTLQHKDMVLSMSFNYVGSLLATTSRDKKIRIWDPRSEKVVVEGPGHAGAKNQRIVWLGELDRLATTGFSRMSDRQVAIWDSTDINKGPIGDFYMLDSSAGICMPYYDPSTKCLYLAGKGDGNIRYYEYENDELFPLSEYKSSEPQRGIAFMPKRGVSVHENEVVRAYKSVNDSYVEPIQFIVPRRSEMFQSDIYPDCPSAEPALSAEEWFSGKDAAPKVISLEAVFVGTVPVAVASEIPLSKPIPAPVKEPVPVTIKEPEPAPVPVSSYIEPEKSLDQAFAAPKVDDMLSKAASSEDVSVPAAIANEESSWGDEEPATPTPASVLAPAAEVKPVPIAEPEPVATPAVDPIHTAVKTVISEPSPAPSPSKSSASGMLASKLEALHSHMAETRKAIESYEDRFTEIVLSNANELKNRDDRIATLESEIDKLKTLILSLSVPNGAKTELGEKSAAELPVEETKLDSEEPVEVTAEDAKED
ncbi:uncharacterized protein V1516DRAFT_662517 [Lipomyces oligophaga]|uniref:uncharacterized protein n=1 Tax=Lipomyces oligophaga TaxID=45792 RepID=UPI0034CD6915